MTARPVIAFVWGQFGPYHMDRCDGAAEALRGIAAVTGIEVAGSSDYYAWDRTGEGRHFRKVTLFPDRSYNATTGFQRYRRILRACLASHARHIFICHASEPEYLAAALTLRLLGRRLYVMTDSKFDDLPRSGWREVAKKFFYLPYSGALVGGARSRAYMRFLGFGDQALAEGYDSISIARIRHLAHAQAAPDGLPFAERHFTIVARLVAKKNIALAIDAYRRYRDLAGRVPNAVPRDLVIYGSGPLEDDLRTRAGTLEGLRFMGFQQEGAIARALASSLALILPSVEEQWGLVVNEAAAMGVPSLVSDQVGARDSLVRDEVSGYVFEPDNSEGLARMMHRIGSEEAEWRRLAEGAAAAAAEGDVSRFAKGVRALTGI
jgi:glycosyltransferase involved in cell wall biosynthesis